MHAITRKFQRRLIDLHRQAIAVVAGVALVGCGVPNARRIGVDAAEHFRTLMNSERYADIYDASTVEFSSAGTKEGWLRFCADTSTRLGQWKRSDLQDSAVIVRDSGGYIVNLAYTSQFESGVATEQLSYVVANGTAHLRAYIINSPVLVR
jgi:hypothetical protein